MIRTDGLPQFLLREQKKNKIRCWLCFRMDVTMLKKNHTTASFIDIPIWWKICITSSSSCTQCFHQWPGKYQLNTVHETETWAEEQLCFGSLLIVSWWRLLCAIEVTIASNRASYFFCPFLWDEIIDPSFSQDEQWIVKYVLHFTMILDSSINNSRA
jgi:hypothetical protein